MVCTDLDRWKRRPFGGGESVESPPNSTQVVMVAVSTSRDGKCVSLYDRRVASSWHETAGRSPIGFRKGRGVAGLLQDQDCRFCHIYRARD